MSIPGGLMPGGGGGPMGGPGAPGGPQPQPPGTPPGGPIDDVMRLISEMQQSPPPSGEEQMLHQASMLINAAYARIAPRSAKAARALAQANSQIQSAREALNQEGSRPMAAPPDLGMQAGMTGLNPGGM